MSSRANAADLRAAYLKLARQNHPDKFHGAEREGAELRMQQINEAWNILGVAHKRTEYDAQTPDDSRQNQTTGSSGQHRGRTHFRAFDDDPLVVNDDIDLDATPLAGSKGVPRWIAFTPIVLAVCGMGILGLGTLMNAAEVLAVGVISLALAAVSFLMLPLLVMSRAERDPDL